MKKIYILIFCSTIFLSLCGQKYEPNWESIDSRPIPEWFSDAKFGIFIHWGPYSVPAWTPKGTYSEWYQYWMQNKTLFGNGDFTGNEVYDFHVNRYGEDYSYYNFGKDFKAELFNPDDWADIFVRSGAKYIVATTKHHDGYCMWPSETANKTWGFPWNSMDIGPKRDLVGELTEAVRKTDVKMGLYYSIYEWFNPYYRNNLSKFVDEHFIPQFKDFVNRYEPSLIFVDGAWDHPAEKWKTPELITWLFNESGCDDDLVINDRWGKDTRFKHAGYYTAEYDPTYEEDHPWEECRGMGFSFGYNRAEDAWDYNDPQTLILMLVDIVSRGGNLLLDIGPDADGKIPPIMQDRLLSIGKWLKVNEEAIYGTRKWKMTCQWSKGRKDFPKEGSHYTSAKYIIKQTVDPDPGFAVKEVFFTSKGNTLFCILPKYPKGSIQINNIHPGPGTKITMLGYKTALNWKENESGILIDIPALIPGEVPCLFAWTLKIEG
ncbi:alpha-L-fucosidase [Bacteroidota bacterium]